MTSTATLRIALASAVAGLLSGCMVAALAPAVASFGSLANGSRESVIQVTVDEKTVTPEIRSAFANAKTLAVVAGDRSSIKAADLFESRGGYQVAIDRPTAKVGEMTGSERREALRKLCINSRSDMALLGRTTKTETGNMMVGALTGRAKVKYDWVMEALNCRSTGTFSFGGMIEFDTGLYSQKAPSEMEELIGAELGGKILDVFGNARSSQASSRSAIEESRSNNQSIGGGAVVAMQIDKATSPIATNATGDSRSTSMTAAEIQKRLIELGYLSGAADGVMGKKTVEALKKFQRDNTITVSGMADRDTTTKLRGLAR